MPPLGLRVAVYVFPPRGDNIWMTEDYQLDKKRFVDTFSRDPQLPDITDLVNNKILHELLSKYKERYPKVLILVVNKAMSTFIGGIILRQKFREKHPRAVNRFASVEQYLSYEQSISDAALRRAVDIEVTDRVAHVLAILAHCETGTTPPQEATSAIFHTFSREALQETMRTAMCKSSKPSFTVTEGVRASHIPLL